MQEVQSLRLCQDHPNIVNINEVYQDGVSYITESSRKNVVDVFSIAMQYKVTSVI